MKRITLAALAAAVLLLILAVVPARHAAPDPLAAPQLLADKLDADRLLARAETYSSMAAAKKGEHWTS